jgi:hypothetical protein
MDGDDAPHAGDDLVNIWLFSQERGRTPGKALKALKRLVHGVNATPGRKAELVMPGHVHDAQVSALSTK